MVRHYLEYQCLTRRSKRGVRRSGIALFSLLKLALAAGFEGGGGVAYPTWARRTWACVSFCLGRTILLARPLDTWRGYPCHGSPPPSWQTGLYSLPSSELLGSLARDARKRGWIWVSWPPLKVFWLPPEFLPLPGLAMGGGPPSSGSPELRLLQSVAPSRSFGFLSDSLTSRPVVVGPRSDSLEALIPCVLGTCLRLADCDEMQLRDLVLLRVSRSWMSSACSGACYPSHVRRRYGGSFLPAPSF
jgi:hypothetical protein